MLFSQYKYRFENLYKIVQEWYCSNTVESIELLDEIQFDPICLAPVATIDINTLAYICIEYDRIRNSYQNEFNLNTDEILIAGAIHELCDRGVCYCMRIKINSFNNYESACESSPEISEECYA